MYMALLNFGKPDFSKDTRIDGERTSATEISNPLITTRISSASFVTKEGQKYANFWDLLMVNGSLMGFNDDLYCLVVEPYPSEKSWSSSVGMMTFPTEWKNNKCSKPPTSHDPWVTFYV